MQIKRIRKILEKSRDERERSNPLLENHSPRQEQKFVAWWRDTSREVEKMIQLINIEIRES